MIISDACQVALKNSLIFLLKKVTFVNCLISTIPKLTANPDPWLIKWLVKFASKNNWEDGGEESMRKYVIST